LSGTAIIRTVGLKAVPVNLDHGFDFLVEIIHGDASIEENPDPCAIGEKR
jgi:hypothetical protein